jgi:hypothetical protein
VVIIEGGHQAETRYSGGFSKLVGILLIAVENGSIWRTMCGGRAFGPPWFWKRKAHLTTLVPGQGVYQDPV